MRMIISTANNKNNASNNENNNTHSVPSPPPTKFSRNSPQNNPPPPWSSNEDQHSTADANSPYQYYLVSLSGIQSTSILSIWLQPRNDAQTNKQESNKPTLLSTIYYLTTTHYITNSHPKQHFWFQLIRWMAMVNHFLIWERCNQPIMNATIAT